MKLHRCICVSLVGSIFVLLALGDHHVELQTEEGSAASEEVPVCDPACGGMKYCVVVDNTNECRVNMTAAKIGRISSSEEGSAVEALVCDPACMDFEFCIEINGTNACRNLTSLKKDGKIFPGEAVNDACSPNPCARDCACQPSCKHELGYQCVSEEGYIGKNCDIAIPTVSCSETSISIEVSDKFYTEFDGGIRNSIFYVSPNFDSEDKCVGQVTFIGSYRVVIPLPFTDCGTFISSDPALAQQGIPFENKLWINRDTGAAFDMPVPVINFTCVYARDYAVTTALQPIIQQDPVRIGRSGKFLVEFNLCKIDSCPAQCPSYLTVKDYGMYTIGQVIHINVKVITGQRKPDFVATLEQMFLSCSSDPFSRSDVLTTMASGGCQRPEQVFKFGMRSGDQSSPESVCANFQVPKAASCSTIFIHVKVLLCIAGDLTTCQDGSHNFYCASAGRKRRSLQSDNVAFATLGPITVIKGSPGRKVEQLYLDGTAQGGFTFQDDVLIAKPVVPSLIPAKNPLDSIVSENYGMLIWIGIVFLFVCSLITLSYLLTRVYRTRKLSPPKQAANLVSSTA